MANTWTSKRTGNWSVDAANPASPWNGAGNPASGVPIAGDTVAVANLAHDIEYDVDIQGAGLAALSIGAAGKIHAKTSGGPYYLRMATAITGAGTLQIGNSLLDPYTPTITLEQVTNGAGLLAITGPVNIFCTEPAVRWCKLVDTETATATRLETDVDVSAWGNTVDVAVCRVRKGATGIEIFTTTAITSTYIDLPAGLASDKEAGSYVVLLSRNVRLKYSGTSTAGIYIGGAPAVDSYVGAYFTGACRCFGIVDNLTVGGAVAITGAYPLTYSARSVTLVGVCVTTFVVFYTGGKAVNRGFICGSFSSSTMPWIYNNGIVVGGAGGAIILGPNSLIDGGTYGVGSADNNGITFVKGGGTIRNCTVGMSNCLAEMDGLILSGNTTDVACGYSTVAHSRNHGGTAGDHRSWNRYGYCATDTVAPLTGYATTTIKATPTSANGWTVFEELVECKNGVAITLTGAIKASATGMTGPALIEIVDPSADPLYDATASALQSYACPDDTNEHTFSLTATPAAAGETVYAIIRFRVKHASGNAWAAWTYTGANGATGGSHPFYGDMTGGM